MYVAHPEGAFTRKANQCPCVSKNLCNVIDIIILGDDFTDKAGEENICWQDEGSELVYVVDVEGVFPVVVVAPVM